MSKYVIYSHSLAAINNRILEIDDSDTPAVTNGLSHLNELPVYLTAPSADNRS